MSVVNGTFVGGKYRRSSGVGIHGKTWADGVGRFFFRVRWPSPQCWIDDGWAHGQCM